MPNFSNAPPTAGTHPGIDLLRTPATRPFVGIVTSDDLAGTPTHYYRNRTTPCEGEGCPICEEGLSWRWHGYLACVDQATHQQVLFEFTAQASDTFRSYRKRYGSLRGCLFKATRAAGRYNGRVTIQTRPADLAEKELPKAINVIPMLCHIWGIPVPAIEITGLQKGHPRIKLAPGALANANGPLKDATKV